jgi:hypothetical protein
VTCCNATASNRPLVFIPDLRGAISFLVSSHRGCLCLCICVSPQKARRRLLLLPKGKPSSTAAAAAARRGLASTPPGSVLLDFEGVGNFDQVLGYYAGAPGGGPDYGVEFGEAWVGLVDSDAGGTGGFANEPSNSTVISLFPLPDTSVTVPGGFTELSFQYASDADVEINVYDDLAGDGNLIATGTLPRTGFCEEEGFPGGDFPPCGDPTGFFGVWSSYSGQYASPGSVATSFTFVVGGETVLLIDDMVITPPCTHTTYWLWDPVSNAPVRELVEDSFSCIPPLYNIEVRPCALPEATPVVLTLQRVGAPRQDKTQKEAVAPFFVWGDNPITGDVFRNTKTLLEGSTYRLTSTIGGVPEVLTFTKLCPQA